MGSLAGDPSEEEGQKGVVGRERNGGGVPDLLEEAWFFRKFIDGSSSNNNPPASKFMGRCFSDPTSSQSVVPPLAPPKGGGGGLVRAPSLPPCIGGRGSTPGECAAGGRKSGGRRSSSKSVKTGETMITGESEDKKRSSKIKASGGGVGRNPGSLARAPSLPPWIGRVEAEEEEEEEEEESDGEENGMSMSRLIQQAMSSSLDDISASSSPKSMIRSSRSLRSSPEGRDHHQQRVISRQSGVISPTNHATNPPPPNPKGIRKLTKTMSNLEIQHDQASYYESKKAAMRPQRPSYDHLLRCGGPPIPTWAGPTANAKTTTTAAAAASSAEDIKAHLKVWARTVAANIH